LEVEREEEVKMTNGRHRVEPIYSTWTQEESGREGVRRLGRDGANLLNSSLVRRSLSAATNSVSGERQVSEGAALKQTGGDQRCAEDAWENGTRVVTLQVLPRGLCVERECRKSMARLARLLFTGLPPRIVLLASG
jgi:hypothetical protein